MNDVPAEAGTRLVVELRPGQGAEVAARAAALLGPEWRSGPVFADDPDEFYLLEGPAAAEPGTPEHAAAAHDLIHRLQDADLVAAVEADLPSTAYWPEEEGDAFGPRAFGGDAGPAPVEPEKDWARDAIRAGQAWTIPGSTADQGAGIRVGHPDTGYSDHQVIFPAVNQHDDHDFVDEDDDAFDKLIDRPARRLTSPGHGTSTASVILGRGPDVLGVAPRAELVPVRATRGVFLIFGVDAARAVKHARQVGCHVVSMSLGGFGLRPLRKAIREAVAAQIIVMAAAGNKIGVVTAPASFEECLAVAATGPADQPWDGSSRGSAVDVSAPGHRVWVANFDRTKTPWERKTGPSDGTSYAVAHLAGVAALWLAHHGRDALIGRYAPHGMVLQEVFRSVVRDHGRRVPPGWQPDWLRDFGGGIVDAEAVLQAPLLDPAMAPMARAAAPIDDGVARIQALLAMGDRRTAADGVAAVLGVAAADLPDVLPRYEAELAYLVLHDAGVAEMVRSGGAIGAFAARSLARPAAASAELAARIA